MSDTELCRKIHFIWLQGHAHLKEKEPVMDTFIQSWATHFPNWQVNVWDEAAVLEALEHIDPALVDKYHKLNTFAAKADAGRYAIVYLQGGMYCDTDLECLRPFEDQLPRDCDVAVTVNNYLMTIERLLMAKTSNCWFYARKGANTLRLCLDRLKAWNGVAWDKFFSTTQVTGPPVFERCLHKSGDAVHEVPAALIETLWPMHHCMIDTSTDALQKRFPHAYSVHHMRGSWGSPISCDIIRFMAFTRRNLDVFVAALSLALLIVTVVSLAVGCTMLSKLRKCSK